VLREGASIFVTEEKRILSQRRVGFCHRGEEVLSQRRRGFYHRGEEVLSQRRRGFCHIGEEVLERRTLSRNGLKERELIGVLLLFNGF
jgi:hypothetical protein